MQLHESEPDFYLHKLSYVKVEAFRALNAFHVLASSTNKTPSVVTVKPTYFNAKL